MAKLATVDPFNVITQWFLSRGIDVSDVVNADDFVEDMFDAGVVVFGYTQTPELLPKLKELGQATAWATYTDNVRE